MLETFNPQNLSNTAWAYAKVGFYEGALFDALARVVSAPRVLAVFTPQNVANLAWAVARRLTEGPEVTDAHQKALYFDCLRAICESVVAEGLPTSLDQFRPQNLASLLHSLAVTGFACPPLFEAAPHHFATILEDCNAQDISNTVWSYVSLGVDNFLVFDCVDRFLARGPVPGHFGAQNVANLAWSFAKAGRGSDAFFQRLADRAADIAAEFSNQNCSNPCGNQPLVWGVPTKLEKSRARSNRSRFG